METLKQISVALIDPHPENPRKDLGDLTELAESIKANGIMQNLTVIPKDGGRYTAVIGHRRLAAAKIAGLETVPCVVVDMDRKTQLSTMLLENMQRSELSYIEQADGFQLMLDLGESVESISEMSGFSVSTVKHRLEIAKLNKDDLKSSDLTLEDFVYLEKIADVEKRNDIIKNCNHQNIRSMVNSTLKELKEQQCRAEWTEYLTNLGMKKLPKDAVTWRDYKYIKSFSILAIDKEAFDLSEEKDKCFFSIQYGSWLYIYEKKEQPSPEETAEKAKLEEEKQVRLDKLKSLTADLNTRAKDFIDSLSETKTVLPVALRLMAELGLCSYLDMDDVDEYYDIAGIDKKQRLFDEDIANGKIPSELLYLIDRRPGTFLLKLVFSGRTICFYETYSGKYRLSCDSKCFARALKTLGFNFTDEDNRLIDGTHELYAKEG